jgi:hypothetical protein
MSGRLYHGAGSYASGASRRRGLVLPSLRRSACGSGCRALASWPRSTGTGNGRCNSRGSTTPTISGSTIACARATPGRCGSIAAHGRRPRLAFVEDRLETLEHVTTHPDLEDVSLFLVAWGYNTPETRAASAASERVRLLQLDQFREGLKAWP